LQKELSTLLGVTVQTREKTNLSGSGRGLPRGTTTHPQLITRISISGAVQNNGWLITGIRDAMKLGLLLTEGVPGLMIPGSLAGDFNVDCQDGYQEISSIIIDAIDLVCNDLSEGEMFVEKEALVEEAELQFESGDRVDDNEQMYRRTSVELVADTLVCGTIQILLPAELYENLKTAAPGHSLETVGDHQEDSINPYVLTDAAVESGPSERSDHAAAVLLIEDSSAHVPEILNSFEQAGIKGVSVSTTDDVSRTDLDSYRAVVLVLERLDEIGFGVVIKIKSSSSVPLLVAASSWTQTEVMKAMRFGVDDIIMLPIEGDELVHTLRERDLLNV
jgi:hypothetical protein